MATHVLMNAISHRRQQSEIMKAASRTTCSARKQPLRMALLLVGVTTLAATQDAAAESSAQEPRAVLEEVVVTSQRREQNLQDVPISVAAFTQKDIEGRGVASTADLLASVANVNLISGTGSSHDATLSVRGVGTLQFLEADQSIGVYVDDVFVGTVGAVDADLADLERIEILRGPQGTLYGRNALGGAVNIVSTPPKPDTEFGVSGEVGDYQTHRLRATGNIPLSEKLQVRGTFGWRDSDGWVRNRFSGTDVLDGETLPIVRTLPNTETKSARVGLRYLPNDDWTVTVFADYAQDGGPTSPFGDVAVLAERNEVDIAIPFHGERKVKGASAKLEYQDDGGFTFQSITGYREMRSAMSGGTFEPSDFFSQGLGRDQHQASQELRFISSPAQRLSWIAGIFYYDAAEFGTSYFGFAEGGFGLPAGYTEASDADVDTVSYAAYAEASYAATDRLKTTLGLRYSYDDKSLVYTHDNNMGLPFTTFASQAIAHRQSESFQDIAPRLTLSYALNADVNLYGSIAKGYKAGGFQLQFAGAPGTPVPDLRYEKETAYSYEVGLKSSLWDRRATLNLAAYYFDWTDQQVFSFYLDPAALTQFISIANAPKSRSVGGELELAFRPVRPLQLNAALGYIDGQFTKYPDPSQDVANADGNRQPYVPRFTADVGSQWTQPLAFGSWITRLNVNHRGAVYSDTLNSYKIDAYTLLNARVGLEDAAGRWSAYVIGKNLTDKRYVMYADPPSIIASYPIEGIPGMGRYLGIELQWWFRNGAN